jgi:ribosome maturation factor RimP
VDSQDIKKIVEAYFAENQLESCFFVDAKITGKKVEIFIDKDGGISYDICRKVSRTIEEILDRDLPFGESYTLDVSSPGVGSNLKLPRQYANNIGRDIEVSFKDKKIKGLLKSSDDSGCVIEEETTVKEGNKKKKVMVLHEIPYLDIIEAKIKISF